MIGVGTGIDRGDGGRVQRRKIERENREDRRQASRNVERRQN
jgi:hypothetical protein